MDLRVQKTKNNILQAFLELRARKPLEKITIKELTEKAQISKQTFYLHYKNIFDLSEQLEKELIDNLMKNLDYPTVSLEHVGKLTSQIFSHAIEQGQMFRIVFSDSRVNVLIDSIDREIKAILAKQNPELLADLRTNIYITVLVQGCYHAYQQYSTIDQERVIEILAEISDSIAEKYHSK